ncbi:MAG TPA: histidine phosphatase family protein, partial [Emticicia sp.]
YLDVLQRWKKGETNIPAAKGGETPEDVAARQKIAFEIILSRPEEELILVAMHGRAIRILLTHLLNLPLGSMDDFEHSNLCLYKLTYSYETKAFTVEVSNDIAHLMVLAE